MLCLRNCLLVAMLALLFLVAMLISVGSDFDRWGQPTRVDSRWIDANRFDLSEKWRD